jgi:hypothetical protein
MVRLRAVLLTIASIFSLFIIVIALLASARSFAAQQSSDVPAWLRAHVGEGEGQIAQVVLQRARALYLEKVSKRAVKNPCYFAMDATRPNDLSDGKLGRRFYVICESDRSFRAISAGHGGGRDLRGIADFANGRRCAKNFGNAMDSRLTAGGAYVTGETKTSFKGYYRVSAKQDAVLIRSFVQFDGEGEIANARRREIGGHPAELLRNVCLRKDPRSPYADHDGYVPFGTLVDYAGGRSNGCTSWSPSDAGQIIDMERFLFERNQRSEILAKGNPRSDPISIQEGSSGAGATANADLQGAVNFLSCTACSAKGPISCGQRALS